MHAMIAARKADIAALCARYGVVRLDVFGSAARAEDFDPARSDADFLVSFGPDPLASLAAYADFRDALETLVGRPVDLVEREAVEASRNALRRRRILEEAQPLYG